MPRAKIQNIIHLVVDVGLGSDPEGFLVASNLVQRKLYKESDDKFSLVLIGSKNSRNEQGYQNITRYDNGEFSSANYSILEYFDHHIKSEISDFASHWILGLEVALENIKNYENVANVGDKKIVLISSLASNSKGNFDQVLEKAKSLNIEVSFLGPNWADEENPNPPKMSEDQKSNFELASALVQSSDGFFSSLEKALPVFGSMEKKSKKPNPWKVELQLGPDIKINVTGYIKVRRENAKPWKRCTAQDSQCTEIKPDVSFVRNDENQEEVEKEDLIESYKYGSQLIAISDADKGQIFSGGSGKSLMVIGFLNQNQIPLQFLLGEGSMVFRPTQNDPNSLVALSALLKLTQEENLAILVRRVYRAGTGPKLGILIPEEPEFFAYVEMPFMEDVREFCFAPLDKNTPEELEIMENLIDSLTEDQEKFEPGLNPSFQHLCESLTYRVLHPGRVLPEFKEYFWLLFITFFYD